MKRYLVKVFGVLTLVALLAGASIAAGPPDPNPGILRASSVADEQATGVLMGLPGVVGFGVGLNGEGRAVIFAFTERPGVPGIPSSIDGVPVVPQVTGRVYALPRPPRPPNGDTVDPKVRFERPVPIGVSTGHLAITAGTIGARVTDGTNVFALSNNHVYANSNEATIGDPVLQPGTYDDGTAPADTIGTLNDFVPILWHSDAIDGVIPENRVDAAIALSTTGLLGKATPSNGYGKPKSSTTQAVINGKVQKYGRTTSLTKGFVWAINSTVDVWYDDTGTKVARFVGQIVLKGQGKGGFSAGGDSGSLVVTNNRNPIGLLFAGNSFFDYTWANPIDDVLTSFGVAIDGE